MPQIYYSCARKLTWLPKKSICMRGYSWASPQIFWPFSQPFSPSPETFCFPGNLFTAPETFVHAQKLLCSMRGFFVSDLFGNAVVPWLYNLSIVGGFGTAGGVSNTTHIHQMAIAVQVLDLITIIVVILSLKNRVVKMIKGTKYGLWFLLSCKWLI